MGKGLYPLTAYMQCAGYVNAVRECLDSWEYEDEDITEEKIKQVFHKFYENNLASFGDNDDDWREPTEDECEKAFEKGTRIGKERIGEPISSPDSEETEGGYDYKVRYDFLMLLANCLGNDLPSCLNAGGAFQTWEEWNYEREIHEFYQPIAEVIINRLSEHYAYVGDEDITSREEMLALMHRRTGFLFLK